MSFCEDFEDTESAAYLADMLAEERCKSPVAAFVVRLATPPLVPKVQIGSRWSGKRQVYWDTAAGVYEETNPMMDVWARWLQAALCPPTLPKRRAKEKVRQPA